jgi:hypothetical protein
VILFSGDGMGPEVSVQSLPTVTLVSPVDQSTVQEPTLTCDASDSLGLQSATLYVGANAQTVSFSGPSAIEDTYLSASSPNSNYGSNALVLTDGENPVANSLLRFGTLIGTAEGQVPPGAVIESAILEVNCTNVGTTLYIYRLNEGWDENSATWNTRDGFSPWSDAGAHGPASHDSAGVTGTLSATGSRTVDMTSIVQNWSDGAPNYGVVLVNSGVDGVQFESSESGASPRLTVTWRSMAWQPVETKLLSGTSATVSFTPTLADSQDYIWNCLVTNTLGAEAWAPGTFGFRLEAEAPMVPVLVSPADGTALEGLSAALEVSVQDPAGQNMDITFRGRRKTSNAFTIAVIPDTQLYSESHPDIFLAQTQWIADHAASENIVFVSHEGDLVNDPENMTQWANADQAMTILDNANIPYGVLPGNHDAGVSGTTNYNQVFPYDRYSAQPWYGGHYALANNSNYQLFSAGGDDYLILHMQYNPDSATIAWADGIIKTNPTRRVIITTHSYMDSTGQPSTLWNELIVENPNIYFVLCGHVPGEIARTDISGGHPVYQLLADYQSRPNGGDGWLRLLRFVPEENKVYVETYSATLDMYETDANSSFALDYPMNEFQEIGTVHGATNGSNVSTAWSNLKAGVEYEWYVVVTNTLGKSSQSPIWSFTATDPAGPNTQPIAQNDSVVCDEDGAISVSVLSNDNDPDGDPLSIASVGQPANGSAEMGASNNIVYTPALNFNGLDSFIYTISDGRGGSAVGQVSVTVTPVNDVPSSPQNVVAVAGDGSVSLSWDVSTDPDGNLLGYIVYRSTESGNNFTAVSPVLAEASCSDRGLENGTTYYYFVTAVDGSASESVPSAEVNATPTGISLNAYVRQNPSITYGVLGGGDVAGLAVVGDGQVQTVSEYASDRAGASRLSVQYVLYTPALPAEITSLELLTALTWDDDALDALHVEILRGTSWEDITQAALAGTWTAAVPADYVGVSGNIVVRFSDSVAVRRERKGVLTIDMLFGRIDARPVIPDTTPPIVSNVTVVDVISNSARVTWNTDEMASSIVRYGETESLGSELSYSGSGTAHSVLLENLKPETTYYYSVMSVDAAGNISQNSPVQVFTTALAPNLLAIHVSKVQLTLVLAKKTNAVATVTVLDMQNLPVPGASVVGDWYFKGVIASSGSTAATSSNGVAVFTSPGKSVRSGDEFLFRVTGVILPGGFLDTAASVLENTIVVP